MSSLEHPFRPLPNVVYCFIFDGRDVDRNAPAIATQPCLESVNHDVISPDHISSPARYTRAGLHQALVRLGCRPRHADQTVDRFFHLIQNRAVLAPSQCYSISNTLRMLRPGVAAVSLPRSEFQRLVLDCLAPHHQGLSTLDVRMACALQERRQSITLLLCGTSGSGKSTLASLLAARLGITAVVSTDSIRNMLRGFTSKEEHPLLCVSTYQAASIFASNGGSNVGGQAGVARDLVKAGDDSLRAPCRHDDGQAHEAAAPEHVCNARRYAASSPDPGESVGDVSPDVRGYLAQSSVVLAHVERLIAAAESRRESMVIEGVHLNPDIAAE
jgi:hypothetical protein